MSEENSIVAKTKLMQSSLQSYKLYLDTPKNLNRLYLYFDTLEIRKKAKRLENSK